MRRQDKKIARGIAKRLLLLLLASMSLPRMTKAEEASIITDSMIVSEYDLDLTKDPRRIFSANLKI